MAPVTTAVLPDRSGRSRTLQLALASSTDQTGAPVDSKPPADRGSPGDVDFGDDGGGDCVRDDLSGLDLGNPDGFDDLDVSFSAAEVNSVIGCPLAKKANSAPLIVTGTLFDGTTLEADNTQVLRGN